MLRYTQTLTLWHGVARVDCSTTIDEFTGEDKLLRLRWPCPVPGAMPVSEVGDAVIGRGFALLHEPGSDESVDTAKHPYTLDNPAYGWFGLSSAMRVASRTRGAQITKRRRACGVGGRGGVADRGGVGAAGARPDGGAGPCGRHRHLQQRRQAPLRGPRRRLQPAGCPDRARRPRPEPVHRGRAGRGRSRLHRGAQAAAVRHRHGQGVGARRGTAGDDVAARGGPARGAGAAGARHRRRKRPRRRGRIGRRRPRRRRDLGRPTGAVGDRAVRAADRRGAQPRGAGLRRRHRRHPAHVADAIVHRLAVRRVDGPAAASHRTRRLELPAAALDPHLRLRAGLRRRRLAISGRPGPQRGVLASAAGRRRKRHRRRRIAQLGLAAGNRARGVGPAGRAEGGGQPARIRQQSGGRPDRGGGDAARRNIRDHNRCRDHIRAAPGVLGVAGQPARGAAPAEAPCIRGAHGARLRDRHRADPAQHAAAARRRPHLAGPRGRGGAAAVRAVLAAQPRPRAARRAARRRAPASAGRCRRAGWSSAAAAYRGQRLHRFGTARHGAAGVPRGLDGQPGESAVRAAERRAPGGRHRGDDAAGRPARALSGARSTRRHRRRRGVDAGVVAAGRRRRRHRVGGYAVGGRRAGLSGRRARGRRGGGR